MANRTAKLFCRGIHFHASTGIDEAKDGQLSQQINTLRPTILSRAVRSTSRPC
jgi:hypothetical protein